MLWGTQAYAGLELISAFFFLVGYRPCAIVLVVLTLVQTAIVNNPLYTRHVSEIDRMRAARQAYTDLGMVAALLIMAGSKKYGRHL